MSLLEVDALNVFYGNVQVLWDVALSVDEGEIVSIVGANGAGKSTFLNAISAILTPASGSVRFDGKRIDGLTSNRIVEEGVIQIPEGRRLFPFLSVYRNLRLGAYSPRARKQFAHSIQAVYRILPVLQERGNQLAGSLSGGEQQMLAMGRGLMAMPKLLMLDEPSLGLAPILVRRIFEVIEQISEQGMTILLIEQDVRRSLTIADRGYVLENGRVVLSGRGSELLENKDLKKAYLGI